MAAPGVEQISPVDAVIGLVPASREEKALESTVARIMQSSLPLKIALVHPPYNSTRSDAADSDPRWRLIADPQLTQNPSSLPLTVADGYRVIFETSQKLAAKACAVVTSDLSNATADWAQLLLQPIVEQHFDLVTPCYARHRFEAMINRSIVYPLMRALYGKRIRYPMGPDFGASSVLFQHLVDGAKGRPRTLPSLAAEAITNGMAVGQSHLGARVYATPDLTNLSSLLAQLLGPFFLDIERYAAHWQKARGSQPVPEFGVPGSAPEPESAPDVSRLIESFQLGTQNLQEVWGVILPPSTLVELRRLARHGATGYRMPDVTWARVVYDFALAHRMRAISRDQMLRALTPIYLGWVASYALEVEHASPEQAEDRVEKLCLAYEETKAYFVSRWRWPDRFNP